MRVVKLENVTGPSYYGGPGPGLWYTETFHEFTKTYDTPPAPQNAVDAREGEVQAYRHYPDWYNGLRSTADAVKLLTEGWKEGAQRIQDLGAKLKEKLPTPKTLRRRGAWVAEGDTIDVDRLMASSDTPWRGTTRRLMTGPTQVNIAGFYGGAHFLRAEELFWQGACAAALADALEDMGYSVRVDAFAVSTPITEEGVLVRQVILKDYDEPLRIDTVAAVLAHAGIFRSVGFRQIANSDLRCGANMNFWARNAGENTTTAKRLGVISDDTLVIQDARDEDSALRLLEGTLQKFTVTE